jgi:hypothetical protein
MICEWHNHSRGADCSSNAVVRFRGVPDAEWYPDSQELFLCPQHMAAAYQQLATDYCSWEQFQQDKCDQEIVELAPDLPLGQVRYDFLLRRKADLVNERLELLEFCNTSRLRWMAQQVLAMRN